MTSNDTLVSRTVRIEGNSEFYFFRTLKRAVSYVSHIPNLNNIT